MSATMFIGRDIVKNLRDLKVSNVADFNWISQLRYYWNNDRSQYLYFTSIRLQRK